MNSHLKNSHHTRVIYSHRYTVESKKTIDDIFPAKNTTAYEFSLRGPDGFMRYWRGDLKQVPTRTHVIIDSPPA